VSARSAARSASARVARIFMNAPRALAPQTLVQPDRGRTPVSSPQTLRSAGGSRRSAPAGSAAERGHSASRSDAAPAADARGVRMPRRCSAGVSLPALTKPKILQIICVIQKQIQLDFHVARMRDHGGNEYSPPVKSGRGSRRRPDIANAEASSRGMRKRSSETNFTTPRGIPRRPGLCRPIAPHRQ
jgi:hypothetical protein